MLCARDLLALLLTQRTSIPPKRLCDLVIQDVDARLGEIHFADGSMLKLHDEANQLLVRYLALRAHYAPLASGPLFIAIRHDPPRPLAAASFAVRAGNIRRQLEAGDPALAADLCALFRQALTRPQAIELTGGAGTPHTPAPLRNPHSLPLNAGSQDERLAMEALISLACKPAGAMAGANPALQPTAGSEPTATVAPATKPQGWSPLHHAAASGDTANLGLLLSTLHQCNSAHLINAVDANGMTPLHLAGHYGQIEAFKLLFEAGGICLPGAERRPFQPAIWQLLGEQLLTMIERTDQLSQEIERLRLVSAILNLIDNLPNHPSRHASSAAAARGCGLAPRMPQE